jgi:hypothetical protein
MVWQLLQLDSYAACVTIGLCFEAEFDQNGYVLKLLLLPLLPQLLQFKTDLYSQTAAQRTQLMSRLWHIKQQPDAAVPAVAGITFASPRVGNPAYANAFKARSLIDPLSMREPLLDGSYNPSLVSERVAFGCLLQTLLSQQVCTACDCAD